MSVAHTHVAGESVRTRVLLPPHNPRQDSALYRRTHRQLVVEQDTPCAWCGVRQSTLRDPAHNRRASTQLETHHRLEWAARHALDWRKVQRDYPEVTSSAALTLFIDSPANMVVLCDFCHRGEQGVHHLSAPDAAIQPYLKEGYIFFAPATAAEIAAAVETDDRIAASE